MVFPSRGQCILWLKENGMPKNIFEHCLQVNRVAVFIAQKLKEKGLVVDVDLVSCGSLLHDIDKHLTLENGGHGFVGKEMLEQKGFPQIARFCVTHLFTFPLERDFPSIEDKIVYYADKRVVGSKIVSLEERFSYLRKRYGSRSQGAMDGILSSEKPCMELEKELFEKLDISTDLSELVGADKGKG